MLDRAPRLRRLTRKSLEERRAADGRRGTGGGGGAPPRSKKVSERMTFGVVVFPGSNCEQDAYHAATDVLGQNARYIWHKDTDLKGVDILVLPGGFAHGDYLRV